MTKYFALSLVVMVAVTPALLGGCGGENAGSAPRTSVTKKLPRANRVDPQRDEEDNDDPAVVPRDDTEAGESPKKKAPPRPTARTPTTAKAPAPRPGPGGGPGTPRPPPTKDESAP